MRLVRSVPADDCRTDPKCCTIPESSQQALQHIKNHILVRKLSLRPYPSPLHWPVARPGSRPALVRLADLRAMRHCTTSFV